MNPSLAAFDNVAARLRERLEDALKRRDYAAVTHVLDALEGAERTVARQTVKPAARR